MTITVNKIKGYNEALEMLKNGYEIISSIFGGTAYIQKGNLRYPVRHDTFNKLLENKKIKSYKIENLTFTHYKLKEI